MPNRDHERAAICNPNLKLSTDAGQGDVIFRLEIRGVERQINVTKEAFEDYFQLTSSEASELSMVQRCDHIRKNLASVITAVHRKLDVAEPDARYVVIYAGEM